MGSSRLISIKCHTGSDDDQRSDNGFSDNGQRASGVATVKPMSDTHDKLLRRESLPVRNCSTLFTPILFSHCLFVQAAVRASVTKESGFSDIHSKMSSYEDFWIHVTH